MPLDRLAVFYKIGDKQTAPGKEHLGLKDMDPVCYVDESEWGRSLDEILYHGGNPIFAAVQHDRRMKPFFQSVFQGTGMNADGTVTDKLAYRPRTHRLPMATLASLTGLPSLEANLRAKNYNVQLINGLTIGEQAFVDASTISNAPRIIDINATTGGDVDVGAGAVLTTLALAFGDLGNLIAALIFGLISNVTESAGATITEDLGGFVFTTTSRISHRGDAAQGYLVTFAHAAICLRPDCEGPGTMNIENLRTTYSVIGQETIRSLDVTNEFTLNVFDNMFSGGGKGTRGLRSSDPTPVMNVYTNIFSNFTDTAILIDGADGNAASVYENNVPYNNTLIGMNLGNNAGTVRRNACYDNTTDFANTGGATLSDNAASDATGGGKLNGVAATDFESVAAADGARFFRPRRAGILRGTDITRLAANTTDIAGNTWASHGDWIGAKAAELSVQMGSWRARKRARGRA